MAQIRLKNRAGIDLSAEYLNELLSYSDLSRGTILLSLHAFELHGRTQGCCVPKQLIERFSPHYLEVCKCSEWPLWDCCIAIANKQCALREKFPAYFTYLVGHEIGHARICIEDLDLHKHYCLIYEFIHHASGGTIHPQELPIEKLCDEFGKYLSIKVHGQGVLGREIEEKLILERDYEKARLLFIRETGPSNDFSGLREKLVAFSMPYKNELIECWKEHISLHGEESLVKFIVSNHHYDEFFE